jgi:O-antigen biosynthesis protein
MVSVLIPTMTQGLTHLAKLLPRLAMEPNIEIIIIDNNSKDGTTGYLSNYDCTVKINKVNLGFAKANNQAAKIAQGDYLLLLNNDTAITEGFVQKMLEVFDKDEKIGIVGSLIYTLGSPKKVQHAGVMFTPDYVPYELGLEVPSIAPGITISDIRVPSVREVPAVTAACMMIKKSVWFEIGGLDEEYINGWEDTDFCLKVREKGYKIFYTGQTSIYHQRFGSVGRLAKESQNRQRYDDIWVHTGRAKKILGDFING